MQRPRGLLADTSLVLAIHPEEAPNVAYIARLFEAKNANGK